MVYLQFVLAGCVIGPTAMIIVFAIDRWIEERKLHRDLEQIRREQGRL